MLPDFDYITGTHGDQNITGHAVFQKVVFDGIKGGEIMRVCSQSFYFFTEGIGTDAQAVRFSGGIDVSQNHFISQGQGCCKIIHQSFGTGIGVRLEHAPEGLMWHVLGCCQGSTDLCGMMCIVVYDGDAADLTFFWKRRSVPPKASRPFSMVSTGISRRSARAMAATAL